ncbi:hypothetical protein GDO78_019503 [Eleutherodactylus coqui]|uniref:Uncharacterized protein n=1 Tax=Eleutherodactylus coqui TaxID=57060 RepID=A0A8J6EPQ8_ELECQ|nr:hypothetical protein GDO78_019503 [Eleutherodactylus coqui]
MGSNPFSINGLRHLHAPTDSASLLHVLLPCLTKQLTKSEPTWRNDLLNARLSVLQSACGKCYKYLQMQIYFTKMEISGGAALCDALPCGLVWFRREQKKCTIFINCIFILFFFWIFFYFL